MTTPSIKKQGSKFIFVGGFGDRLIPKAAGFRWNPENKYWWTDDPSKASQLLGQIKMSPALTNELEQFISGKSASLELSRATSSDLEIPCPDGKAYYPFQKAGIQFASSRSSTLFGDEMGIGKTIQAIGTINADPNVKSVLVICPASLRLNWQRELESWLVNPLSIGIADSKTMPTDNIVIINYDILSKQLKALTARKWDVMIVDEAHYIKNPKTARCKAVVQITKKASKKLFLSGTPIPNRPIEGWPIFNILDPITFNSFWNYATTYCNAHQGEWGWEMNGASNLEQLQKSLRSSIMIRRLKSEVLKELPPKVRQVITLPMNGLKSVIEEEQESLKAWKKELHDARKLVSQLAPFTAAGEDPTPEYLEAVALLNRLGQVEFSRLSEMRAKTALAKVPYVVEHVKTVLQENEKVVVMAHHHDVIDQLSESLNEYGVVTLTGRDTMKKRDESVTAFQTGSPRIFIGSILAAGVGLTLTAASTVVFAELDWVPGNVSQAEDRCHRIGQDSSVLVQHLVVDGSIDANMAHMLVKKQTVLDALLDDEIPDNILNQSDSSILSAIYTAKEAAQLDAERLRVLQESLSTVTEDVVSNVHTMLQMMAGLCDGARTIDNMGFNKLDVELGMSLARSSTLSPRQAIVGKRILKKYHRQLPADIYEEVFNS